MRLWWACAWLATIACFNGSGGGSSSGVPGNTRLPDLSSMQRTKLCDYLADVFPRRTITCGDTTISLGFTSASECVAGLPSAPTCTATVDQSEACFEELGGLTDTEICELQSLPSSCSVLLGEECQPQQPQARWAP